MTPTLILCAYLLLLGVATATARAADPPKGPVVAELITATWKCQDKIPMKRSSARYPWRKHSPSYWEAEQNLWQKRLAACRDTLRRSIPNTDDWVTAVNIVQRVYPGTKVWLLYISRREGGHGGFVMNHQGSGAGGWMQFMSSTFYAYNDRAYADLKRRGWRIDPRTNSWTNPLGQAVTAGYMRYVGLDGCHWCL